jgi:hypothetical protein
MKKEIFGEADRDRSLTKKQMQQLFRFLRRVEKHYEACSKPPIPPELEASIRSRDSEEWLPWEMEAIEKVEVWREQLHQRRAKAREMLNTALDKVRRGPTCPGTSTANDRLTRGLCRRPGGRELNRATGRSLRKREPRI